MSFRYSYTATITGDSVLNENGDPISEGVDIPFMADYQPSNGSYTVKYSGDFVNVQYRLFVPINSEVDFKIGAEVECNGIKGVIASIFPTRLNIELWVQ